MLSDARMLKDKIEVAREELSRIPPAPWNAVKVADRIHEIETMTRQLARLEALHESFQDRRAELLARCGQFRTMH